MWGAEKPKVATKENENGNESQSGKVDSRSYQSINVWKLTRLDSKALF